jgi:hypothetical protein
MPEQAIARAPEVLSERVGDDTAVLDPATGRYTRLNRSGSLLWEMIGSPMTAAKLADRLVREYGIEPAAARRDVESFVASLREQGLVVPD